jgi:hypothetical protein
MKAPGDVSRLSSKLRKWKSRIIQGSDDLSPDDALVKDFETWLIWRIIRQPLEEFAIVQHKARLDRSRGTEAFSAKHR